MTNEVDLAIVGAGIAGLAAARTAIACGRSVIVLEASRRIGGRAHTDTTTLGVPFDRGCFLLHSASENPLVAIAGQLGFHVSPRYRPRLVWLGGRWAGAGEYRAWERYRERSEGRLEALGRAGIDHPIAQHLTDNSRWRPMLEAWIAAYTGVDTEDASTRDFYAYRDTRENLAMREGLGALIVAYGQGVPVHVSTPVTEIDWSGRGVELATPKGTIAAKTAVISVSMGVLGAEAIRFAPALPERLRNAIAGLPMGHANKIAFRFDRDVFGVPPHSAAHLLSPTRETSLFQLRPFGWEVASGYIGGKLASQLERDGEQTLIDFALERLKDMFGNAIGQRVVAATATGWDGEAYIRGAYSAALPGQAHQRTAVTAPVGDRLFFAGEACHPDFFSTAHGAYLSGVGAASAAMAALDRIRRPEIDARARFETEGASP